MPNRVWLFILGTMLLTGPAAAQSNTLDKIRSSGVITMGYIKSSAPFSFVDEKGEPQGYSVDLCRAIATGVRTQLKLTSLETHWVPLTIQNRLEAVAGGKVDIECSTTTWTFSRQQLVDFSLITFLDGASILTRVESKIGRIGDLSGKRVAVIRGTTTEKVLHAALSKRDITADVVTVGDRVEGLKLLDDSSVDGFASDRTTLIGIVMRSKTGHSFKLLDEDFSVEQYALALPRGDPEFRLAVNRALARLFRTGSIQQIYDRWLGKLGPPSLLLSTTYFIQGISE